MNIVEAIWRQAVAEPDRIALIAGTREMSYGLLKGRVLEAAAHLSSAGVQPGEVVALVTEGHIPHIVSTLALAHLGAVSVALAPAAVVKETDNLLEAWGIKTVVHNFDVPRWPACVQRRLDLRELRNAAKPLTLPPMAQVNADDLWRISMSSGTTGAPKAIGCTWRQQLLRDYLGGLHHPAAARERVLVGLGAGLSFALHYWLRPLSLGGTVIFGAPGAPGVLEAIQQHQPTLAVTSAGVAINMARLAAQEESPYAEPSAALQELLVGGGRIAPRIVAILRRRVCPSLSINYGSTEGGLLAVCDSRLLDEDPRCAGRLLPWVQAEAVGDDGTPLPAGEFGRLRLRSATLAAGYYPPDAASPDEGARFEDGSFLSADIGHVRPDGRVYLRPRTDVLNNAGLKIEASRVEAVIMEDPAVLDCAVVMVPGRLGQPAVAAVVMATSPVDREQVQRRCAEVLGPHWVPTVFAQVAELPRNEGGKVIREAVRQSLMSKKPADGPVNPPTVH